MLKRLGWCGLAFLLVVALVEGGLALAQQVTDAQRNAITASTVSVFPLIDPRQPLYANSVQHGDQDVIRPLLCAASPPLLAQPQPQCADRAGACTSQLVAGLNPTDLVLYLETTTVNCLRDFIWTLDPNMCSVLGTTHVIAVLNAIATISLTYQGNNTQNLYELMDFAHAAYYHKSYNPSNSVLFDLASVEAATKAALDAFAASPGFNDANPIAAQILYDWVCTVDAAVLGDRYYAEIKGILDTFNTEPARWCSYDQGTAVWATLYAIQRQIVLSLAFQTMIDPDVNDYLRTLAMNIILPTTAKYLATNAIWVLGSVCANVTAWKTTAVQAITDARSVWPQLISPQWLWTVKTLSECNNCLDANGALLCMSTVVPQLEALALPNTYTFDDGSLVVRTPLTLNEVQLLYHATKVVEAQFDRLTQTIAPLPDDPNGELKVVLFGNRTAYVDYAPILYALNTGNGGVYIEQWGTFFTYDRTPYESIYPLEELFRHEFTHYLAGRCLVGGMWGDAPIYQNGRMVWFDEGLAEFCTWGTTDSGIKPRRRLVELVQSDGPNRMTVSQVLSAVYGDEKFYRYSALLFGYLYQHDLAKLLQLIDLVRAGNVGDYDAAVAQMKVDVSLQPAFGNYLDGLVSSIGALDDPFTIIPPLNGLDIATPADVQTHARQTRIGYLAECSVAAVETNTRFSARGTLSGTVGGQQDLVVAWHLFDANLDEMIQALQQQGVNNFTALTGRFGKIRWVDLGGGQSYPMADYFVDGPLVHGTGALQLSLQQVTADFQSTRLGVHATGTQNIPTTVEMHVTLATVLHSNNVSSAVLLSELEDGRTELRNQVYAIRPPYYRSFTVDWVGGMQTIQYPNQQVYGLRDVICQVYLP